MGRGSTGSVLGWGKAGTGMYQFHTGDETGTRLWSWSRTKRSFRLGSGLQLGVDQCWDRDWNGSRTDHRVGWGQRVDQERTSTRKDCDRQR